MNEEIENFPIFLPKSKIRGNLLTSVFYNSIEDKLNVPIHRRVDYLSIVVFENGDGFVKIDDEVHTIQKGKAVVVFPGQFSSCNLLEGTKGHHLMATRDAYEAITSLPGMYVRNMKPVTGFTLSTENYELLLHEISAIKNLLRLQGKESEELVRNRFKTVFLILKFKALKIIDVKITEINNPLIVKFTELIEINFRENHHVNFYADQLHIVPNYLNILCKRTLKISAKQMIKNRLLEEAKRLIISTDLSLKEIGYCIGMELPRFSSFFRKETGLPPSDFIQLRKTNL